MKERLIETFEYICKSYFPRFDRKKEWKVKHSDKIYGEGHCDRENKVIMIKNMNDKIELKETFIHELCHAVTADNHTKRWKQRMLKTSKVADMIGEKELAKRIR